MQFWKWLWENPQRGFQIGLVAWVLGVAVLLLITTRVIPDAPTQVLSAVIAAGAFSVWSLMFSVSALASYARVVGDHYEERFRRIESRLEKTKAD